jgi:tRNA-dihydrouridine synthase A
MLGRQAYQEPYLLAQLLRESSAPHASPPERDAVLLAYADYVDRQLAAGHRLPTMLRHVHGLYAGLPSARAWRRYLAEQGARAGATADVLRGSLRVFDRRAAA